MHILVVPFVPHTTVVNRTIVYSDTVLPLKDVGDNFKVTSIEDVSEDSLEECLKKILEFNPNVIFNTIQYSKKDKKVYFYTDKTISIQAWEEGKVTNHKPLNNSEEILGEVENILNQERVKDTNYISLYDVANLMKKFNNEYDRVKKIYCDYFRRILKRKYNSSSIIIYDFDYLSEQLQIGFKYMTDDYEKIVFAKQDKELHIVKNELSFLNEIQVPEILSFIGKELSELYDEFMKFSDFKSTKCYDIKSSNSNFLVNISQYGVGLVVESDPNSAMRNFELSSHSNKRGYYYKCDSTSVLYAFQGKEDEIFKKTFVRIDDCPEWSRQTLYKIRQEQLVEEKRSYKETKKRKRKIFPWTNK